MFISLFCLMICENGALKLSKNEAFEFLNALKKKNKIKGMYSGKQLTVLSNTESYKFKTR